MPTPVIVEAVRTPIGRRHGMLAGLKPQAVLARTLRALIKRSGIDPALVGQVFTGCATQTGEQGGHVGRHGWLYAGLPPATGVTTIDAQGGSGQQAVHLAAAMIQADIVDVAIGCGIEMMSRTPTGDIGSATARPDDWSIDLPDPFTAAERVARRRGLARAELDEFGLRSRQLAAKAWADGRFDREIVPIELPADPPVRAPVQATTTPGAGADSPPATDGGPPGANGSPRSAHRDEGLCDTSARALAALEPLRPGALHTTGSTAQISDGAAAVLLMTGEMAQAYNLTPRARIRAQTLVGTDPRYHLDGSVESTERVLAIAGMSLRDIDLFEVNEAYAAVALSWAAVHEPDMSQVNRNGGAIALGHPTGAGGSRLVTTALHELERADQATALVTTSAGGALSAATILERL